MFNGIHHLAFITNDMNKTIRFYRDLLGFPLVAGVEPSEFALEGSEPRPGQWPEMTPPTPPEQWTAYPGSGFEFRPVALGEKRGKAVGE